MTETNSFDIITYQREWLRNRRAAFFSDKACVLCGSKEKLELDHIDPAQKKSHRIWSWTEEKRSAEIAKCQVLCRTCHRAKTNAFIGKPLKHGTDVGYSRKCRCELCTKAHAIARKEYRARTGRR